MADEKHRTPEARCPRYYDDETKEGRCLGEDNHAGSCWFENGRTAQCSANPGPRWTVSAYLVRDDHVLLVRHKLLKMWLPIGGGIEASRWTVRRARGFPVAAGYGRHRTNRGE